MIRAARHLLYLFVGLLLGGTVALAHAETIPATYGPVTPIAGYTVGGHWGLDPQAACQASWDAGARYGAVELLAYIPATMRCSTKNAYGSVNVNWAVILGAYRCTPTGAITSTVPNCGSGYSCPATGGWSLAGQTCTRPDCESPNVRDESGACVSPCQPGLVGTFQTTLPLDTSGQGNNIDCQGQCEVTKVPSMSLNSEDLYVIIDGAGKRYYSGWMTITKTGNMCSVGKSDANDGRPPLPEPKKTPPCGASEGVLTTQSGGVKCVPEGVPDAPRPRVDRKNKVETFQDGSTKTTAETKTTDTRSGASHTSTQTTVTAGTNGQPGEAGTPGTSTGSGGESSSGGGGGGDGDGDGDGDCEGEDCGQCDPKLEMCGDPSFEGMYEKKDKTVAGVLGDFSTGMQATPIGQAFGNVFNVQTPAGSCPALSASIPYLNTSIDLAPYICSATAIQYFQAMGTILKIVVGYIAFTWILF